MARAEYGATIAGLIYERCVGGASSRPIVMTEYYSDTESTWKALDDVMSREISLENENKRYLAYTYMPPVQEMSLVLNNAKQQYSFGSSDPKNEILKKNLKIRCWSGYELNLGQTQGVIDDLLTSNKLYKSATIGGTSNITTIIDSTTLTINTSSNFRLYDDHAYDSTRLSPEGYYYKLYPLSTAYDCSREMVVDVSDANVKFKYKTDLNLWSPYIPLGAGLNTIPINSAPNSKSLSTIFSMNPGNWGTATHIHSMKLIEERKAYMFLRGTFYIDEPEYNDTVVVKGRDALKKALETQINLPDMTGTIKITKLISDVCDRCNISYDTAEWDMSSTSINISADRAEDIQNISGWKALDYAMDALNAGGDVWRLSKGANGNLVLINDSLQSSLLNSQFTITWQKHIESITKSFDSDKQLQRVTVTNKDLIVKPEETLLTYNYTSTTSLLLSYATAIYVRYEQTALIIKKEIDRGLGLREYDAGRNGIWFETNNAVNGTITIYGCKPKNALTDEVFAEFGNSSNILKNDGQTHKVMNPFFDLAKCEDLSHNMISRWADPPKKIQLTMNANPYLENNDNVVVRDLYTYTNDVYTVFEIKENWNPSSLKDTYVLKDSGIDIVPTQYDLNGYYEGVLDHLYDLDLYNYDIDINPGEEDNEVYTKPFEMV